MYCSDKLKLFLDRFLASLYVYELDINPTEFNNAFGLKNQVIGCDNLDYNFPNDTLAFNAILDEDLFSKLIKCEVSSEYHRIKEQINNVNSLLKSSAQPAWIIVTVYYACFFYGKFI